MRNRMGAGIVTFAVLLLTTPAFAADEKKPDAATSAPAPQVDDEAAKRLKIGSTGGWWQPGANIQGWYVFDHYNAVGSANGYNSNTFRIRRAELSIKGEIWPKTFGFNVMIDPARVLDGQATTLTIVDGNGQIIGTTKSVVNTPQNTYLSPLQDVYITYLNNYADLSLGQFKIPVSWEGVLSSSKLLFPERALVSKQFGDKRDIGLRAMKKFKYFMYWAAVYNGSGQNTIDTNSAKDLALRLEVYPLAGLKIPGPGLMLGGVVYSTVGDFSDPTNPWKVRYEADVRFEGWGAIVQAEYISAQDRKAGIGQPMYFGDGYYLMLGYTFFDQLQFAFRMGQINGDKTHILATTDSAYVPFTTHLEGAVNWRIKKDEIKIHASYSRFDTNNFKPTDNQVIVALQVAY